MKFVISEEQYDKIIQRNLRIIPELVRTTSLSKHPLYNKVRVTYDGERFIVVMHVNTLEWTKELGDYLDKVYRALSDFTIKPVYVEWRPVK